MDLVESTDVGSSPSTTVEESTSAAASSVSPEESSQTAGSVTAGTNEASVVEQGDATPPPSEDDPLKGIPSSDELKAQVEQRVPYAQAVLQLREALEARNNELSEIKGKYEPLSPVIEKYSDPQAVQNVVETHDLLFTPVIDPQTNQQRINPETGLPDVTTAPFIERVDSENPGMAVVLAFDALRHPVEVDGQKTPLYKSPLMRDTLLKSWGLDPNRLNDYQNIDALSANTAVTPEELNAVPEDRREAYKTLPASLRGAWESIPEDEKQYHLDTAHERLEARNFREQQVQQQREAEQQQVQQAQAYVSGEQAKFVSEQLQEGYSTILNDLASKVTFSDDQAQNAGIQAAIGAFLYSLRDPDFRQANKERLEALGVRLDSDFDNALLSAEAHYRNAKAYELFQQKGARDRSLAEARNARNQVLAKLAPIALKVATAMGGQMKSRAEGQGRLLKDATQTRPNVTENGNHVFSDSPIPGMSPMDPRFGVELWKQMQSQNGG